MVEYSLGDFLKNMPLFLSLTQQELARLSENMIYKVFSPGEVILQQGKKGIGLFLIRSGEIGITIWKPGNIQKEMATLSEGDFFGEVTLLSENEVTATVTAKKNTKCFVFTRSKMDSLREFDCELAHKIEHGIAVLSSNRLLKMMDHTHELLEDVAKNKTEKTFVGFKAIKNTSHRELSMDEIDLAVIKDMPIFKKFSDDELDALLQFTKVVAYDRGYEIYKAETSEFFSAVVYSGAVQLTIDHNATLSKKMDVVGPGEMLGQLSLVEFLPHVTNALVREEAVVLVMTREKLDKLKDANHKLWIKIYEIIYKNVVSFLYIIDRQIIRLESEYEDILK